MGLSGDLQGAIDDATGALLGLPGGTVLVEVAPPGSAPPVADVPAVIRYANGTARELGRAGAQRTGAVVRLRRASHPTRPIPGSIVTVPEGESLKIATVSAELAWWKCEATRA